MDVHAVARLGGIEQRREARAQVVPAGDLAHDLLEHDAAVRAREALGGHARESRTGAARTRAGSARAARRLRAVLPSPRRRTARRGAAPPARTPVRGRRRSGSWNSCSKLDTRRTPSSRSSSPSASRRKRRGQHSHGWPSVSTMSHSTKLERAVAGSGSTRTRVSTSGSRRRSPVEPNGLGSASGPSGVSAWLAGTQPTPAPSRVSSSDASSERPRTIAPRSQQTSATRSAALTPASRPSRCRCPRCPRPARAHRRPIARSARPRRR